jgi:alpha-L-rhamnosidase
MRSAAPIRAHDLRCDHEDKPLGVAGPDVVFTWRGPEASAFRIQVALLPRTPSAGNAPERVWDSGRTATGIAGAALWPDATLLSATRYAWRVLLWDMDGEKGEWSDEATFETGLLRPEDWTARWIHPARENSPMPKSLPAPYLRKSFRLDSTVVTARAYVCGLGLFELHVNGDKVGDAVIHPAFTKYDSTCLYTTYDLTAHLHAGDNAIGVVLGNGMYHIDQRNAWDFEKAPWKEHPKLLARILVLLDDGSVVDVGTDSSWKAAESPIRSDSLHVGETYDARLELSGWSGPEFDDSSWARAEVCRGPGGRLVSLPMEPVRKVAEYRPASMREASPGVWVYDLGRAIAGWSKLTVQGPAGTTVKMRHAENLDDKGLVDDSTLRMFFFDCKDFQCDAYTLKGDGIEVWEPRFTYHGFQHVQLEGYPGTPDLDTLTACEVHTDFATAGGFSCSDEVADRIQAAARASTVANYHGMPTDCPHREKNPWTGDAALSSEQVLLNYDPLRAYRKWMRDLVDAQRPSGQLPGIAPTGGWGYNWGSGPAWDSALVLIPWNVHVYTGDVRILRETFDAMLRYLEFVESMSEDETVDFGLGDWVMPQHRTKTDSVPTRLSDTWFWHLMTRTTAKIARVIGRTDEAVRLEAKASRLRETILRRFVDPVTGAVAGDCQTSYALVSLFGIVDGELAAKVFGRLVDEVERCGRHIDCGILGAKYVLQALAEGGRTDLAWAIASQRDYPSWGDWIQQGATTLWENWEGDSSRIHHMFSDVSGFFYKEIAGLKPEEAAPGFHRIRFAPHFVESLSWAEAWHETPHGRTSIRWERQTDGVIDLHIEVPEGSLSTLWLPEGVRTGKNEDANPECDGNGRALYRAGSHRIRVC